jgi:hypothetical protein
VLEVRVPRSQISRQVAKHASAPAFATERPGSVNIAVRGCVPVYSF